MKLKHLIILFLTCSLSANIFAQGFSLYKYEFYYGIGGSNLMADVCAPKNTNQLVWVKFFNTVGFMGDVGLRYNFADRQYANVNLSLGQLYAKDLTEDPDYWDAGRKINTFFTEITGRYEYVIVKEKKKKTVYRMLGESFLKNINVPTYLFIGAGGMFNIGNFAKTDPSGENVQNELYSNFSFVIPYGIGFKTRLSNTSQLNLEVGLRFAFSDNIDNVKNGWYDQYQFITFNYVKKLRANKNGLPKF
jgi:hypothetical protein